MLRHGVSLPGVCAVLRHTSPQMTMHYAKVDFALLSEIAQPWAGRAPHPHGDCGRVGGGSSDTRGPASLARPCSLRALPRGGPGGIHDLRHSFATRVLQQCGTQRDAVARHFVALATYMGHADIAHTYWSFRRRRS
jgi:hypothetical protein